MSLDRPSFRTVWRTWFADLLVYGFAAFPLTLIGRLRRAGEVRVRRVGNGPAGARGSVVLATLQLLCLVLIRGAAALNRRTGA